MLPPLSERLPLREDILVVQPRAAVGRYGGTVRYNATNPQTFGNMGFTAKDMQLANFTTAWEEVYPEIARSIELAADSMSAIVTLRRGMRWSDGAHLGQLDFTDKFVSANLPVLRAGEVPGGYAAMLYPGDLGAIIKYQFNITVDNPGWNRSSTICAFVRRCRLR
jgi:peptide/nickel transport system substrate-binding protein